MLTATTRYEQEFEYLKTNLPEELRGCCITGGSLAAYMTPGRDVEDDSDLDIFAYNTSTFLGLAMWLKANCYTIGSSVDDEDRENLKFKWSFESEFSWSGWNLSTLKFRNSKDLVINLSVKKHRKNVFDIIADFDMSIVCIGYDMESGQLADIRGEFPNEAKLNPWRKTNYSRWEVSRFLRQYDRLDKYASRGYDVTLARQGYVDIIENGLKQLALFTQTEETDAAKREWEECLERFKKEVAVDQSNV
jgi:hypothetical protein